MKREIMDTYVRFGYGSMDKLISQDGELLATLGFTREQLENEFNPQLIQAFDDRKLKDDPKYINPHSGDSWANVCNVAYVLVKNGWKTIADIPEDHSARKRVVSE